MQRSLVNSSYLHVQTLMTGDIDLASMRSSSTPLRCEFTLLVCFRWPCLLHSSTVVSGHLLHLTMQRPEATNTVNLFLKHYSQHATRYGGGKVLAWPADGG